MTDAEVIRRWLVLVPRVKAAGYEIDVAHKDSDTCKWIVLRVPDAKHNEGMHVFNTVGETEAFLVGNNVGMKRPILERLALPD